MTRPLPRVVRISLACAGGVGLGLRFGAGGGRLPLLVGAVLILSALLVVRLRGVPATAPGRRKSDALLLACAAWVGFALGAAALRQGAAACGALLPDGALVEVRGALEARPWPGAAAPFAVAQARLVGRAGAAPFRCRGTVRVKLRDGVVAPGAGIAAVGRGTWWAQPPEGHWPQPPERAGVLSLESLAPAPGAAGSALLRARDRAQVLVRESFGRRAALAESLVLAQQSGLDPPTRDRFAASGLSHLLAISGSHVVLVAAAILLLARLLGLGARAASIVAAAVTVAYVLFIGAPLPALRSCLQLAFVLAARLLQRPADSRGLVAECGLIVLVLTPFALIDAGFQLSFAGVLGILVLRPRLLPWLARMPRLLRESVATSTAATLATAPIAIAHFGQLAPVGVVANIVAVPLAGIAVPAVALSLAVSAAAPAGGRFLADGAGVLLAALDGVARAAAAVPGGHLLVPADSATGWTLASLAAAAVAAAVPAPRPAPTRLPRRPLSEAHAQSVSTPGLLARTWMPVARLTNRRLLMGAGTAAALVILWPAALRMAGSDRVEIWTIDVGQGDALAIRSPAGRWILVDAGPRDERFDAGRSRVVPFLLAHGAHRLEVLVLTHPDADHVGGAPAVLGALAVGEVADPGLPAGRPLYVETLRAARGGGARWTAARAGRALTLDGMRLDVLAPGPTELRQVAGAGPDADANEASVVLALTYGRFRALLMGDAPADEEQSLLGEAAAAGRPVRADVLKLGHHGSATSTSGALLDAVLPRAALISVGRHNRFGHPAPAVLRRLARRGVRVYRTDEQGAIGVVADARGSWKVETAR